MLMGIAREQVKNILEFLSETDLRVIELKIVPGTPRSSSTTERIHTILSCASQPSEILLQRSMRKSVLRRYLWQNGINVTQEQSKSDYIRILLVMWQVQDDDFLKKPSKKPETNKALNRLQPPAENRDIQDIRFQNRQRKKGPMLDPMRANQQHCSDSTPSGTSSPTASLSSSTKSSFSNKEDTHQSLLNKRKREASPDEINITMDKLMNSSAALTKVESICVTPDIKPDLEVEITDRSPMSSPSSSTKLGFPREHTQQSPFNKKTREASPDEISITMEKLINNPVPTTKVENICVTPDIQTDF